MLDSLNQEQREIVSCLEGPMLVLAGAGSGKTRVIVHRMVNLIRHGTDPRSILLLTFTKKAAEEMLSRAASMLGRGHVARIFGGTFHHFCNSILRRYPLEAGLQPGFTIIDAEDSRELISRCRKKVSEFKSTMFDLPKSSVIHKVISMSCNHALSLEETVRQHFPALLHHIEALDTVADQYRLSKSESNGIDFDDMLTLALKLLSQNQAVYEEVASIFRHIMVDEYQDTNRLQAELALLLARPHGNLMVVGDDMQSIYSFRGAYHRNILDFPRQVEDTKIFSLSRNYRSTPEILQFANGIIASVQEGFHKELIPDQENGELPQLVQFPSDAEQADWVAGNILASIDNAVPPGEIAVLYRAHSHSLRLQTELMRRGIPFSLCSGLKFMETAHIKDLLAWLKLLINQRDEVSYFRLFRHFPGVGEKTVARLVAVLRDRPLDKPRLNSIRLKPLSRNLLNTFLELYSRHEASSEPVNALMDFLNEFYFERLPLIYDNAEERHQDIMAFVDIAAGFGSVEELLDELTLLGEAEPDGSRKQKNQEDSVVLSSVHQAKGLEWNTVFVLHCQDGAFPNNRSFEDGEKLDEEFRLFYVAVTRARQNLTLCYPMLTQGYRSFYSPVSRFFNQLSSETFSTEIVRGNWY